MPSPLSVIDVLKSYHEIELFSRETSYQLYKLIIEEEKNKSMLAYLIALAIPVSAALSLVTKVISDICRVIDTVIQSINQGEYAGGNLQTLLVDAVEYCRSFAGLLVGILVSLYSPSYAAETFLTVAADPTKTFLTTDEGSRLYAMADRRHDFFVRHKIDYRICSGTALGAVRETGIICNDDDIDLMLHPNSVDQFNRLIQNGTLTQETGISIEVQEATGGWQCFYSDSTKGLPNTPSEKIGKPYIDIFPGTIRHFGDKPIITYGKDAMYLISKGDYFTTEEWDNPILYNFGPTRLFGVNLNAMKNYLCRCYGPSALNYKTRLYPHDVYTAVYASPLRTFSILAQHPLPRYMRHIEPEPLDYDKETYATKIALGNML